MFEYSFSPNWFSQKLYNLLWPLIGIRRDCLGPGCGFEWADFSKVIRIISILHLEISLFGLAYVAKCDLNSRSIMWIGALASRTTPEKVNSAVKWPCGTETGTMITAALSKEFNISRTPKLRNNPFNISFDKAVFYSEHPDIVQFWGLDWMHLI